MTSPTTSTGAASTTEEEEAQGAAAAAAQEGATEGGAAAQDGVAATLREAQDDGAAKDGAAKDGAAEDGVEDLDALIERFTPGKSLRRGEIIDGKVLKKSDDALVVNIGHKSEGIVPAREMRSFDAETLADLSVGDEVIAYVVNPEDRQGSPILSIDRARGEQGWRILEKAMESQEMFKGTIVGSNRGGAVVEAEGVQGFVPLSQLVGPARGLYVPGGEDPKEGFIGMEIEFKVIELNRLRNRAIFSERAARQAWKTAQKERLVKELNEGDTRKGRVTGISSFGAFVDLGGADGLVHISELSWEPVRTPEDVVKVGQEVEVYVLKVDREGLKIALSLRRLQPEPWQTVEEKYSVGQVVNATVTKLANFGAFARLEGGLEGLIHISELADEPVSHPRDVVSEGDDLEVRILRIEPERRRLGLSVKQVPADQYRPEADRVREEADSFEEIFESKSD